MLNLFIERNLQKTINFILKNSSKIDPSISSPVSITMDPLNVLSISFQNNREYLQSYNSLLCEQSRKYLNSIVFCPCCSSVRNFLRNHSLYNINNNIAIVKIPGCRMDPFLDYITVLINKDINLLINIIESVPLFWEAHLTLVELTSTFIEIDSPLKEYFYSYLKITKDLPTSNNNLNINNINMMNDSININNINININNINNMMKYENKLDVNTLAALHYCLGNIDLSLKLFKSIDDYSDISFFEFYGILLYNSNDPTFRMVVERCKNYHSKTPECLIMTGLYNLLIGNIQEGKDCLKKAYKHKNTSDIACLIACSFVKLNDHENACNFYKMAYMTGISNFRILYSIAQGYFNMNKLDECFSYCKMALEIGEDGTINKLLGKIHNSKGNLELAERYFEKSLQLGEIDSLLYLAETYKKRNQSDRMIEMYERYLRKGEKNVATVAKYMIEYYEEKGEYGKAEEYKQYMVI